MPLYDEGGNWSGYEDSNPGHPRPKRGALARLSYTLCVLNWQSLEESNPSLRGQSAA